MRIFFKSINSGQYFFNRFLSLLRAYSLKWYNKNISLLVADSVDMFPLRSCILLARNKYPYTRSSRLGQYRYYETSIDFINSTDMSLDVFCWMSIFQFTIKHNEPDEITFAGQIHEYEISVEISACLTTIILLILRTIYRDKRYPF